MSWSDSPCPSRRVPHPATPSCVSPRPSWWAGSRGCSTASRRRCSPSRWRPGPSWRTCARPCRKGWPRACSRPGRVIRGTRAVMDAWAAPTSEHAPAHATSPPRNLPRRARSFPGGRRPQLLLALGGTDGFQDVAAHVGAQRLGDHDRAVLTLVVLQDRDDPPGRREGPVEGRGEARFAVLVAVADVEPSGLELGAVGGRRQLTVSALSGDPGLAVVLAGSARPQVTAGNVDDAVG